MDPVTGWSTLAGLLSLLGGLVGWLKYRRTKREKLGQAIADDLGSAIKRAESGNEPPLRLRVDKKDP